MKSKEYFDKIRHLDWLKDISRQYKEHLALMDREKDHYTVHGIGYTARCDGRVFNVNPHRPIPSSYIYDGISAVLSSVNAEIETLERELKKVTVEL